MIYIVTMGDSADYRPIGVVHVMGLHPEIDSAAAIALHLFKLRRTDLLAQNEDIDFLASLWTEHGGDPLICTNELTHKLVLVQMIAHLSGGQMLPFTEIYVDDLYYPRQLRSVLDK